MLERWFRAGAADGFNVMPPFFPGQFDAFVDQVVPLLQERGLFRADYAGTTLRDHLGLKRPARRSLERHLVGRDDARRSRGRAGDCDGR